MHEAVEQHMGTAAESAGDRTNEPNLNPRGRQPKCVTNCNGPEEGPPNCQPCGDPRQEPRDHANSHGKEVRVKVPVQRQ